MENEALYQLQLSCGNCYHKWGEMFPKGFRVVENGFSEKHIFDHYNKLVKCPVCECTDIRKVYPSLNEK